MLNVSFLNTAMTTKLFVLFGLFGYALGNKLPDVDCKVIHLKYVSCVWNQEGTSKVNYTLISWFKHESRQHVCANVNSECVRPYVDTQRFQSFSTTLVHGNRSVTKIHDLKSKVLLNPPTNLTVLYDVDKNLWFYWNQTLSSCVKSEVRFRTNKKNWKSHPLVEGRQSYCINLAPLSHHELQVRSKVGDSCGMSEFWSDWSEPVEWGSNNSTEPHPHPGLGSAWTPVLSAVCAVTLLILAIVLLHHERLRVIPVVPKPAIFYEEDWFQFSKGLKESLRNNYNERACPVREYCPVSQSDSESSSSSTSSLTTDQTNCSVSIPADDPGSLSEVVSSSASAGSCEEKELQESV